MHWAEYSGLVGAEFVENRFARTDPTHRQLDIASFSQNAVDPEVKKRPRNL